MVVRQVKAHWGLLVPLLLLWEAVGLTLLVLLNMTHGVLVYALDDPYIHMAIAKNFSQHGVWGITAQEFTSSSSSLLWTLSLAGIYKVFGVHDSVPFILNVVAASLVCLTGYFLMQRADVPQYLICIALLALIFFTPLPLLIFTGQEHILHALLTLVYVFLLARFLNETPAPKTAMLLVLLTPLLVMTRYEGVFLVGLAVLVLLVLRSALLAALVVVSGVVPLGVYALISVQHGWFGLPNSVLMRGSTLESLSLMSLLNFAFAGIRTVAENPQMLVLVIGLLAVLYGSVRLRDVGLRKDSGAVVLAVLALALHMQFARVGWLYRYEAYLIVLGIVVTMPPLAKLLEREVREYPIRKYVAQYVVAGCLIAILLAPLAMRGYTALTGIVQASMSIYRQQYQMGRFVQQYYGDRAVALHDVGAVNYLAQITTVDLVGLTSREIGRARITGTFSAETLVREVEAKGVDIAVVYDHWLDEEAQGPLFSRWVRAGQWRITGPRVTGGDTVTFYAVKPGEEEQLRRNLREFAPSLPPEVIQSGDYTRG